MEQNQVPAGEDAAGSPEERLERGGLLHYPQAPFPLPAGDDLQYLLTQELGGRAHKNIGYDPVTGKVTGYARRGGDQAERLRAIFGAFSRGATAWMARTFPRYAAGWQLDRCSYRPQEEATRRLRQTARNDLIHVDAFPSRPSQGHRILRVFANVNPRDPRIWVTSDPFAKLLLRYGAAAGLPGGPGASWLHGLAGGVVGLFRPRRARRSAYDSFMIRFHDHLKKNDEFQERGPKRLWAFLPGAVWVAMTDTCSHAVLRGRFALEHSYFVAPSAQALPLESPPALMEAACAAARGSRAA